MIVLWNLEEYATSFWSEFDYTLFDYTVYFSHLGNPLQAQVVGLLNSLELEFSPTYSWSTGSNFSGGSTYTQQLKQFCIYFGVESTH